MRTGGRERLCDRTADTPVPAGDECDFSVQVVHSGPIVSAAKRRYAVNAERLAPGAALRKQRASERALDGQIAIANGLAMILQQDVACLQCAETRDA